MRKPHEQVVGRIVGANNSGIMERVKKNGIKGIDGIMGVEGKM